MRSPIDQQRRRLVSAGALAATGLGLSRTFNLAHAATVELPMLNGTRNLVAFPE